MGVVADTGTSAMYWVGIGIGAVVLYGIVPWTFWQWCAWLLTRRRLRRQNWPGPAPSFRTFMAGRYPFNRRARLGSATSPGDDPYGPYVPTLPPDPPPELITAMTTGRCVLVGGSLLRRRVGLSTGAEFLQQLVARLDGTTLEATGVSDAVNPNAFTDLIAVRYPRPQIESAIHQIVGPRAADVAPNAEATTFGVPFLDALRDLPVAGYITLAWDGVLQATVSRTDLRIADPVSGTERLREAVQGANATGPPFFLYAKGSPNQGLVLTDTEFDDLVRTNESLGRFITSLTATSPLMFVGCSVEEIESFAKATRMRPTDQPSFALVTADRYDDGSGRRALESERLKAVHGITVILVADDDGVSEDVFVRNLARRTRSSAGAPGLVSSAAQRVTRVRLEDVGGFTRFEMEFAPQWNVLLGDNGSGKSTILRAIALALTGDDPRTNAGAAHLIRWGTSEATVVLQLGDVELRTALIRSGRSARVAHGQISPVESGALLALGFPALRGASYREVVGPTDDATGRNADHLLPLVSNSPDTRLDTVKQWIVNTSARGNTDLLDEFFRFLNDVFSEHEITRPRVDPNSWDVLVTLGGNEVPLSVISQGMASVLGWVGVLMQRMFDAAGADTTSFSLQHGIVLIDEIDAHLHPGWQRTLVPALRRQFPNVQFIATTHSPLVAADLATGELHSLHGTAPADATEVDSLRGLPVDDILVSDAFRLTTRRDVTTEHRAKRYEELLSSKDRSPAVERELAQLERAINGRRRPKTPEERDRAFAVELDLEMSRRASRERFEQMPKAEQQAILEALDPATESTDRPEPS